MRYLIILWLVAGWSAGCFAQKFFEVDNASEAQVKLFPVWEEKAADLKICIVYDEKDLKGDGIWMEVSKPEMAELKVIFVDDEKLADIKVILVDNSFQAGWNHPEKKSLLTRK